MELLGDKPPTPPGATLAVCVFSPSRQVVMYLVFRDSPRSEISR